jgi:hypothetical protein
MVGCPLDGLGAGAGGLSLRFDSRPALAVFWVAAGATVSPVVPSAARSLLPRVFQWYQDRFVGAFRLSHLDARFRDERTQTEAVSRSSDDVDEMAFAGTLAVMPLVGVFYGILLGPILGALWRPSIGTTVPASAGAALGLVVGPAWLSAVAGVAIACVYRPQRRVSARTRWLRRGLIAISAVLLVPALLYALTSARRQRW